MVADDDASRAMWLGPDGALAGVGARLVEGVARKLTERFWEDFAQRVEEETAGSG
jgi:carbon monoxide dehydrogenase subunit G